MTREEAIRQLEVLKEHCFEMSTGGGRVWLDYAKSLEMAIKTLEKDSCEDVIGRAEAMTEIMMFAGNVRSDEKDIYIKVSDAVQLLRELPPVTPTTDTLDKIRNELLSMECMEEAVEVVDKYRLEIPFDGRDEE